MVRLQKENNGYLNIAGSIDNCECIVVASSVSVLRGNMVISDQSILSLCLVSLRNEFILQSIPYWHHADGKLSTHSIVLYLCHAD